MTHGGWELLLRASLKTTFFFKGFIFSQKKELIFTGKNENPVGKYVSKLVLREEKKTVCRHKT
jgi:hypothetical protein